MRKMRKRLFAELTKPDQDVEHGLSITPVCQQKDVQEFVSPVKRPRFQQTIFDVQCTTTLKSVLISPVESPATEIELGDAKTTSELISPPTISSKHPSKAPTCSALELSIMLALQTNPAPLGSTFIKRLDDGSAGVSSFLRELTVDWMADTAFYFQFGLQTLAVSVRLLDELLAVECIPQPKLHIFAVACISIASKLEEDSPPGMKDLTLVCGDFPVDQLFRAETQLIKSLQYCLIKQTAMGVITWLAQRAVATVMNGPFAPSLSQSTDSTFFDSRKISEQVVTDAQFALLIGMLDARVSSMSAAAVAIAATRIALCVNGLNGDGMQEWDCIDGVEKAVVKIIKAWFSIEPRKSKRTVFDSHNQSAAAFERTRDVLRVLSEQADGKCTSLRASLSASPVTASPLLIVAASEKGSGVYVKRGRLHE